MQYKSKYIVPIGPEGIHILNTGDWRTSRPVIDKEKCIGCGLCLIHCPVNSIRKSSEGFHVDYAYCKGCGVCAHECRVKAISMEPEGKDNEV